MPYLPREFARISASVSFYATFLSASHGLFLLAGALLVPEASAWAQVQTPAMGVVANNSIRVESGERVILPYSSVSRIIVEDPEIARALFQQDGTALIEGIGRGTTTSRFINPTARPNCSRFRSVRPFQARARIFLPLPWRLKFRLTQRLWRPPSRPLPRRRPPLQTRPQSPRSARFRLQHRNRNWA